MIQLYTYIIVSTVRAYCPWYVTSIYVCTYTHILCVYVSNEIDSESVYERTDKGMHARTLLYARWTCCSESKWTYDVDKTPSLGCLKQRSKRRHGTVLCKQDQPGWVTVFAAQRVAENTRFTVIINEFNIIVEQYFKNPLVDSSRFVDSKPCFNVFWTFVRVFFC